MGYKTVLQKSIPSKDEGKTYPAITSSYSTTKDMIIPCHVLSWPANFIH